MSFPPYGDIIGSIVVKFVTGNLVDVLSGAIYPACVNMFEGKVVRIERKVSVPDRYIIPGLIDSHLHVESSHLAPHRFAENALVHGTTAVIADPSPAAGTMGADGLAYMQEAARATPLRFHFTAPSDIPGMDWRTVRSLLTDQGFIGLGEASDHAGVIGEEQGIMSKLEAATQLGKRVDGHAPGLRGYELDRYIMSGVSSDHECVTSEEAMEKHRKGMVIAVREGSASRNMEALLPFALKNKHLWATDHLRARDLQAGHIDLLLRESVAEGLDPVQAVRAATLWPAEHYGIPGGALQTGAAADLVVVSDLRSFNVLETWINGEMVAKNGEPMYLGGSPPPARATFPAQPLEEITVMGSGNEAAVNVMNVGRHGEVSWSEERLEIIDGHILADPLRDILYLVWAEPSGEWRLRTGFVRGFDLTTGALASSEVYKFGGIAALGTSLTAVRDAMNEVAAAGGGAVAITEGRGALLPLPVAGMMSDLPLAEVVRQEGELLTLSKEMGCPMSDPFLRLAMLGPLLPRAFQVERPVMSVGA